MVDDKDIERAEGGDGGGDEGLAVFRGGKLLLDGDAVGGSAKLGDEGFGLLAGALVAEGDAGTGLAEETNGSGSDAARASGDEGGATGEGQRDAGGRIVHRLTLTKHLMDTQAGGSDSGCDGDFWLRRREARV